MNPTCKCSLEKAFLPSSLRLVLLAGLLVTACESSDDGGGDHDFGDRAPSRCAVVGDSFAIGFGDAGAPWPARLAHLLGRTVANYSAGGRRMAEAPAAVDSALSSQAGFLIISLGANDAISGSDPEAVKGALGAMIDRIQNAQAVALVGNVSRMTESHALYNDAVDQINRAIGEVCSNKGVRRVNLHGTISASMLQPDGLHPNTDGQEAIAQAFYSKLKGRVE